MSPSAFISDLVNNRFNLFNVDSQKCPCDRNENRMANWNTKNYDELVSEHNYNSNKWGLSLGKQSNDRYIMSLDFDCYDKDIGGDCPATKLLLTEYLANCSNSHGLYSSSTEGNMNVLVDYSSSESLKSLFAKIGGNKFQNNGLEILIRGNQVIPPTQTKCKKTQTLGNARTFKTPDFPFYIINGEDDFTFKFIEKLCNEKLKGVKIPKEIHDTVVSATQIKSEPLSHGKEDKFIDLLFNVIKNEKDKNGKKQINMSNGYFFQIAGALKNNNYDFDVFERFTNLLPNKTKTNTCNKLWNAIQSKTTHMSIFVLQNIAKMVNPVGYKSWLQTHGFFLTLDVLSLGENDIAKFISSELSLSVKFCCNEWWIYKKETCLWTRIKDPSAIITTFTQIKINEALENCLATENHSGLSEDGLKELNKKKMKFTEHYKSICKGGFCSQLVRYCKDYLNDDAFLDVLDDGLYKMVFANGVFCLKTMNFRKGLRQDDYVTKTIPFDYNLPREEDIATVKEKLKQICNYNDSHLDYYLSILGYTFTGDSSKEQLFFYHRGQTASNGKSVPFEVLESLMPNYVMKANSDMLDKGADLRKEIATWGGIKMLWLNEVSTKRKDEDLVKALCDGTSYKYNRLYATEAVLMPIKFNLFAVSNNSLTIKADAGTKRRFKLLQHDSQFKDTFTEDNIARLEFKQDKELKSKLMGEHKDALIYLIMQYSHKYWIDKRLMPYPQEWADGADETMDENDEFGEWFFENFEVGEGKVFYKTAFDEMVGLCPKLKGIKAKDELVRMKIGVKYDYKRQENNKTTGKRCKGFWLGFCKKDANAFGESSDDGVEEE